MPTMEERIRMLREAKLKEMDKTGQKVIFKGVPEFYYPMFTNVAADAKRLLGVGEEYTVTKHEIYSSWQSFELEGIPGFYHTQFFRNEET